MTHFNPDPKPKTFHNRKYEKWVAERGCLVCTKPAEPHHVRRIAFGAGTGTRPHSYVCVPVCREHHEPEFIDRLDIEEIIIVYMVGYIKQKYDKRDLIETLMEFIEDKK